MYDSDERTESGVYYLVKNRNDPRGGKTVIRRPRSPLTSAPLPDDFDAYTQDAATTVGRAAGVRNSRSDASPLEEDFDANTFTASPTAEMSAHEYRRRQERFRETGYRFRSPSQASERFYGLDPTMLAGGGGFKDSREYGQYMAEMDQIFGGSRDISIVERPLQRQQQQYGRRSSQSQLTEAAVAAYVDDLPSIPSAPDYEVVDDHVVEDGPERTVTISTWRERVANEGDSDQVAMSVYYINADDYLQGNKVIEEEVAAEVDSRARRNMSPFQRRDSMASRTSKGKGKAPTQADSSWQEFPLPAPRKASRSDPSTAQRNSPPRSGSHARSQSFRSTTRPSPPRVSPLGRAHLPSPPRTPNIGETVLSSTPIRDFKHLDLSDSRRTPSPPKPFDRERLSRPSFHPTRSGSTISSIKSRTGPQTLEQILHSCKPSLVHIMPALKKLGIHTVEHLRAVGSLSEETRDREVRDVALKMGVTVVEWAILLDRLLAL